MTQLLLGQQEVIKNFDYLSAVRTTAQTDANQTAQLRCWQINEFDLFARKKYLVSADPNHTSYGIGYAEANALVLQASENLTIGIYEDDRSTTVAWSSVTALAKIQADLGMQGLSLVSYLEQSRDTNATQTTEWYYQPEHGWIWTNRTVYPYLYKILIQLKNQMRLKVAGCFTTLLDQTGIISTTLVFQMG